MSSQRFVSIQHMRGTLKHGGPKLEAFLRRKYSQVSERSYGVDTILSYARAITFMLLVCEITQTGEADVFERFFPEFCRRKNNGIDLLVSDC